MYNLTQNQIYTITCDDASNMVKLARIMNDECEEVNEVETNVHEIENDCDYESDFEYENREGTSLSTDEIESELFNDCFENNGKF